jgi:hypothetical protein
VSLFNLNSSPPTLSVFFLTKYLPSSIIHTQELLAAARPSPSGYLRAMSGNSIFTLITNNRSVHLYSRSPISRLMRPGKNENVSNVRLRKRTSNMLGHQKMLHHNPPMNKRRSAFLCFCVGFVTSCQYLNYSVE